MSGDSQYSREIVVLGQELESRRQSLALHPRETQLQVMSASMDIRGLEALYNFRLEQNAHFNTKKDLSAEISALKKKVSSLEHEAKVTTRKLSDAQGNIDRLKNNLPTMMCFRCKTLTTEDREKNDTLRLVDACTKLRRQMESEAKQLVEIALSTLPKERCECGFVRFVGDTCAACLRKAGDPVVPEDRYSSL